MRLYGLRCGLATVCLAVLCQFAFPSSAWVEEEPAATSASIFDFHNGFWVNLHHFLYREAVLFRSRDHARSLELTTADQAEFLRATPAERASWDSAVFFYRDSLAQRDLLFDDQLIAIKDNLENAEDSPDLENVQIPSALKAALTQAAPIYRKYWWPRHQAENQQWIRVLEPLVHRFGPTLVNQLATIYEQPWPQYPVRVDVVAYANWAGAYTTIRPTRPTISTTDPANQGPAALEIVFHETTHGMMDKVMDAIHLAEHGVSEQRTGTLPFHSGSIWHAVLFDTAGILVSEQIPGYVPYANKNGLWKRAWPDPDHELIEKDWEPHMRGKVQLQPALTALVRDLAASSPR